MDNQRLLTWAFFGLMAWITYQTWMQDYAPPPATPVAALPTAEAPALSAPPSADDLPEITAPTSASELPAAPGETVTPAAATPTAPVVRVTTDVLDIEISTLGGTLQRAALLKYPVAKDRPDTLIELLSPDPENLGRIETGMRSLGGAPEATHLSTFDAPLNRYDLDGADEMVVLLSWTDPGGISIEKRYRFQKGSYAIQLEQEVTNGSTEPWRGAEYARIKRYSRPQERSMFDVDSYSFAGPIVYDGEKSQKLKRDDLIDDGKYEFSSEQGWFGAIQHHFVTAVVPPRGEGHKYQVAVTGHVHR